MKTLSRELLKRLVEHATNMSTQAIEEILTACVASRGGIIVSWRPNGKPELCLKRISYEDMYIGGPEGSMYG